MSSPFMDIQGDQENKDLLVQAFRALITGRNEVEHLGRKWKVRYSFGKRSLEVPSYLQTMIHISQPDDRNRCKVRVDLPHIIHEEGCYSMAGMAVPNQTGEASVFLFRNRGESQVKIEMARNLIQAGKVKKADLAGVLNEWELSNV